MPASCPTVPSSSPTLPARSPDRAGPLDGFSRCPVDISHGTDPRGILSDMDARLRALALAQSGVVCTADAARLDIAPARLDRLVGSGELVRVRRGAFVLAQVWGAASATRRHTLRALAVVRTRPGEALSHHSALLAHGIPTYAVDLTHVALAGPAGKTHRRAGVRIHPYAGPTVRALGVPAVPVAVAIAQLAGDGHLVGAVVAGDHALHSGVVSMSSLEDTVQGLALPLHRRRGAETLARMDPACESVGESRTRLLLRDLGFAVTSQVWIEAAGVVARVDFVIDDLVVVEFDGAVKYGGADGRVALVREKQRESALVDAGYEVVRLAWPDLDRPVQVAEWVHRAVARARRRRGFINPGA